MSLSSGVISTHDVPQPWSVCKACGSRMKTMPANYGDQHRCGPYEWAERTNALLERLIDIAVAFDEARRGLR